LSLIEILLLIVFIVVTLLFLIEVLRPPIPTGLHHSAQGCEQRATLGNRFPDEISTLTVVESLIKAGNLITEISQQGVQDMGMDRKGYDEPRGGIIIHGSSQAAPFF